MFKATITSDKITSEAFKKLNIFTFEAAAVHVKQLKYGRTEPRDDFLQVLHQEQGTCSSKHALLMTLAQENQWKQVQLHLIFFAMSNKNTPGIGDSLDNCDIPYMPEAHCALSINDKFLDVTSSTSAVEDWESSLLKQLDINPQDIIDHKVKWHRSFIQEWISQLDLNYSLEELWQIRENCILALSQNDKEN